MTRNVTDAAVLLGAMTGVDPDDGGDGRPGGSRLRRLHGVPRRRRARWRPDRRLARGHLRPDRGRPREVDAIFDATGRIRWRPSGRRVDPVHQDPHRAPSTSPSSCAPLRVQGPISRAYLETYTGCQVPEDAPGSDRFQQRSPRARGALELADLRSRSGHRPAEAHPDCIEAREFATSTAQAAINDTLAENDLDAIIAPTNGPAWVTNSNPRKATGR